MKVVSRYANPPLSDESVEQMFDDIYKQFPKRMNEEVKERLAVWIADKIASAYVEGYEKGCNDTKLTYEVRDETEDRAS